MKTLLKQSKYKHVCNAVIKITVSFGDAGSKVIIKYPAIINLQFTKVMSSTTKAPARSVISKFLHADTCSCDILGRLGVKRKQTPYPEPQKTIKKEGIEQTPEKVEF